MSIIILPVAVCILAAAVTLLFGGIYKMNVPAMAAGGVLLLMIAAAYFLLLRFITAM